MKAFALAPSTKVHSRCRLHFKNKAESVVQLAKDRRMTLATVESCTAGALAYLLAQAKGASNTLHGGFIVYTKENKIASVGVPRDLYTAVSGEMARAMATGGLARCPATLVAAITGVAGPEPDGDGNPVGLVYVAIAARDGRARVERLDLGQRGKDEICGSAMRAALMLFEDLLSAHVP